MRKSTFQLWAYPFAESRISLPDQRRECPIMAGLCGLFVAALVAKANIEELNSLGVLFSALLYGSIGFYLGTSISATSSNVTRAFFATDLRMNPIALASATGT